MTQPRQVELDGPGARGGLERVQDAGQPQESGVAGASDVDGAGRAATAPRSTQDQSQCAGGEHDHPERGEPAGLDCFT